MDSPDGYVDECAATADSEGEGSAFCEASPDGMGLKFGIQEALLCTGLLIMSLGVLLSPRFYNLLRKTRKLLFERILGKWRNTDDFPDVRLEVTVEKPSESYKTKGVPLSNNLKARRSLSVGNFSQMNDDDDDDNDHNRHHRYSNHMVTSIVLADTDEGETPELRFRRVYKHIKHSKYSKLCLPPTCQRIELSRKRQRIAKISVTSKLHMILNFFLWITQYEYWRRFWFLFLPQIYIIFSRSSRKEKDESDDSSVEGSVDTASTSKQKHIEKLKSIFRTPTNSFASSNTPQNVEEKKNDGMPLSTEESFSSIELLDDDDEHGSSSCADEKANPIHHQNNSANASLPFGGGGVLFKQKDALAQYRKRSNTPVLLSTAPTPSNTIIKQQQQHPPPNTAHIPNTLNTASFHHPHISTIFPSLQTNNAQNSSTDAPMNFFDAETSSAAIQKLTQTLPDQNGYILGAIDKTSTPLLVFVNSRSGPQQGHVLLNQLRRLLNPIQIYDLALGNPESILQSFSVLKNLRILVCGGDGTVSWIISSLENLNIERWPPIAILPLGTGNDLARIHGWGGGYSNESLLRILTQVQEAYVSLLDRWELTVIDKKGKVKKDKCFMNYLGVGVDAQVAYEAHMLRESEPTLFFSRFVNKAWYGIYGAEDTFIKKECRDFLEQVTLVADGVEIPLPADAQGIVILNIDSYSGGAPLWSHGVRGRRPKGYSSTEGQNMNSSEHGFSDGYGFTFPSTSHKRRRSYSGPIDPIEECDSDNNSHFNHSTSNIGTDFNLTQEQKLRKVTACDLPSSCQDGLLDIVSVRSAVHLGQIRVGLSNATVICQCREVEITIKRPIALQVDGEPWRQSSPSTLKIKRKKDPAMMLHRAAEDGCGVETEMSKLLDWAEDRHIIDMKVHDTLMKEFSRRIESKTRKKRVQSQDNLMLSLKRAIANNNNF